jgi:hypothetical protein
MLLKINQKLLIVNRQEVKEKEIYSIELIIEGLKAFVLHEAYKYQLTELNEPYSVKIVDKKLLIENPEHIA